MKTLPLVVMLLALAEVVWAEPPATPAAETSLPGSRWTVEEVVKGRARTVPERVAYVAVYEALENASVMVGNMTDHATQKFKVVSVLAGPAPEGEVTISYAIVGLHVNEREIKKGERVVWVFIAYADQRAFPVKALPDNDSNRRALLAALKAAGLATTQPASTQPSTRPIDKDAAAKFIRQLVDEDFAVREAATKQLIGMGEDVRPLLAEKAKEKALDPEVADRIQKVIAGLDRRHWPVLKGKVVDESGSPVENAMVWPSAPNGPNVPADEAWTDADGTFVLRLRPGLEWQELVAAGEDLWAFKKGPFRAKADEAMDVGVLKLAPCVRDR